MTTREANHGFIVGGSIAAIAGGICLAVLLVVFGLANIGPVSKGSMSTDYEITYKGSNNGRITQLKHIKTGSCWIGEGTYGSSWAPAPKEVCQ